MNPSTRIQAIVEEDLRLRDGDFGIWSQLDDEKNDDNHLLIRWLEEVNWVMLQALPSNRSIHLLYLTHEGATPLLNIALENTENLDLQTFNCSCTSTWEVDPSWLLVGEETKTKTTNRNESSIDDSSTERNKQITPLPPPPYPPPPPPEEDSDSDSDMGHGSAHIPLYEGDEDPRWHWFVCESTWEANQVMNEDR